jgi:pyruvate dehydrogenase E1 component beta subunit
MLREALADPDPVIIFEHATLYNTTGPLEPGPVDLSSASVRRSGTDLTVVASAGLVAKAIEAADRLAEGGMSVEVIDLRSLRPIDRPTLARSVNKTHRVLVVDEGWKAVGLAAELSAGITEDCFYALDAPVRRLTSADVPIPYPKHLEEAAIPTTDDIAEAAAGIIAEGRASG